MQQERAFAPNATIAKKKHSKRKKKETRLRQRDKDHRQGIAKEPMQTEPSCGAQTNGSKLQTQTPTQTDLNDDGEVSEESGLALNRLLLLAGAKTIGGLALNTNEGECERKQMKSVREERTFPISAT